MNLHARASLRAIITGIVLSLLPGATTEAQPEGQNPTQEGTSRIGSRNAGAAAPTNGIDAQTGKILNEAIEPLAPANADLWLGIAHYSQKRFDAAVPFF